MRSLTAADWDVAELNERRLKWLQQSPDTRYSHQGVIAIDDVLIDHDGQFIKDVGWFWDPANHTGLGHPTSRRKIEQR